MYQFYLVCLGRKKWSLHKSNGKGDNLPNEGVYRAKEFDTTWAGPGGGGGEEKEASSSQGPQNTQLLPNVKPVPLYSLVIDTFFTHIYYVFTFIKYSVLQIFRCRAWPLTACTPMSLMSNAPTPPSGFPM